MDLARLPETSSSIDDRLASLADPELADRLADVHPDLFATPPSNERAVVTWTARRFGIAAVALTAVASVGVGYVVGTSYDRKPTPKLAVAPSAPSANAGPRTIAPAIAPRVANAHHLAAVHHAAAAPHAAVVAARPIAAPVRLPAAPIAAPVASAPVHRYVPVPVAPAIAHDAASAAEEARLRARIASENAEIARLRARALAQTEAARAERIRAAQAMAAARTAQSQRVAQSAPAAAHAPLAQSADGASAPSAAGDPATTGTAQGGATQTGSTETGTDPTTTGPQNPQVPPQGGHHHGFGIPFPVGGPVDSCSPQGGRLSTVLINAVLNAATHGGRF